MKTTFYLNGNDHTVSPSNKLDGVKAIHVKGNRWFQKSYGNTYHKAYISILIDEVWQDIGETDIQYGYGDQYLTTAGEWLIENGYIESDQDSGYYANRLNFEQLGIAFSYTVQDVSRKRDL